LTAPNAASATPTESRRDLRTTLALHLAVLLFAAAVLFFAGLGRLPLLEPDEGRNAEVAREMLASGDWITPHFNSLTYLDKPAVYFWMVAASLKAFGISEGAARLPSAVMAAATLLLVWFLARRMFGDSAGLRAGVVFGSCPLVIVFAREVIFDMTLTFFVTLAMVAFWLAEESDFRRPLPDLLMFGAMGVAIITKGPVGILLPLLSIVIYEAVRGHWRELKRLRWGWGLLVFFAVALPWFIAVSVRNPDFPRYALWYESLKRFATGSAHRGGGILYYLPVYLGGLFPWSLFLLLAAWNRLRRWRELKQAEGRPVLFLLCWAVLVFGFFTVSQSKLPGYFLPAVVPLSILMRVAWRDVGKDAQARPPDWLTAGFALLLGIGIIVAAASHSWVFASAQARLAKKLHPGVLALLKPSLLYSGLILCALAIVGRNFATRLRGRTLAVATFILTTAIVPVLVLRWLVPLRLYAEINSSRRLATTILASPERESPLFGYSCFRTSLPFYLRRPVGLVSAHWGEMTSNYQVQRQAEARRAGVPRAGEGLLLTPAEFRARVGSTRQPLLVMVLNSQIGKLSEDVERIEPLWNEWDFSIWEVSPAKPAAREKGPSRVVSPFMP
jgi:4-amino-4-deoxy-L-arabinose transferase-like glycosyltransferase